MKFKKIISLLASMAMMVTAVTGAMTASASEVANGTCGDGITWTLDSDGKLTISGEGKMATPSVNDFDDVKQIGDYFEIYTYKNEHMEDIKEVVIKEGVTSIGFCAFYKMPNLETVVLPSTITRFDGYSAGPGVSQEQGSLSNWGYVIQCYSFAECTSLKNLSLTEGMTCIGGHAFNGCTSLESVRIPTSITLWGIDSFSECSKLKDITLPEGLKIMGADAFIGTAVESVVIPSTIETWYQSQYKDRSYELSASWTNHSFAECKNLSSVTFTEGLKIIGGGMFCYCSSLKKVFIPKSVIDMKYTFARCDGLEEVYIEDGAQFINKGDIINGVESQSYGLDYAFYYCENLKKLEIPYGVTLAYTNPQWCTGCSSLTDIYRHGMESDFPSGVVSDSVTIHCDYGSKIYKSSAYLNKKIEIEEDIENALKELNTAVTEAEKYAEADYTTESYGILQTALENAKKYDESSTGVLPIEWAADDIMTAIEGLEEKKDEPPSSDPSDSSSNPSDSSNPSGSDQSQPSNSGSSQPTSAQPVTNAPTTASPKVTPPAVTTTVTKPAKVKAVKLKAKKNKLNVSWKKVSGATGYEVQYATNNKFTKNKKTVTVKKNKVTLKKLKPKKKYFVKVRAYKLANGRKYFGKWSKVVKKKVK